MNLLTGSRFVKAGFIFFTLAAAPMTDSLAQGSSRPFRLGVLLTNPQLDAVKPLAVADQGGWILNSDVLVGNFSEEWVGGLSIRSRKILWWLKSPGRLKAPPVAYGSWVVLGFVDGTIMKVETLTGKVVWQETLNAFTERPFLLVDTRLIVFTASQYLYALDFQSGKPAWIFDAGFPDGLTIRGGAAPVVHDGKVIVGVDTGEVLAVNLKTGKLLWRYNPSYNDSRFHDVVGELVVQNNRLVLSRYDGFVAAIDLGSSERSILWQDQLPGVTTSAFRAGRYYVGTVGGDVHAYDLSGGRRQWSHQTGQSIASITPGEVGLFVASTNGRISTLALVDGKSLWHDDIGGEIASRPFFGKDAIYFSTGIGNIYGYRLK